MDRNLDEEVTYSSVFYAIPTYGIRNTDGIPTECEICWLPLVTYVAEPITNIQITKFEPTCLALQPCESRMAGTRVAVNTVGASSTILTRCVGAFVYIWIRLKTNVACKASHISRFTDINLLYLLHWSTRSTVSMIDGWCLIERNYLKSAGLKIRIGTFLCKQVVEPEASA